MGRVVLVLGADAVVARLEDEDLDEKPRFGAEIFRLEPS